MWRKCSSCKKPIALGARYYVCNVSTCNSQRTGYVFCSVVCFENHLPTARHRDAYAVEEKAPMTLGSKPATHSQTPQEILVIASRLKEYVQARSEFSTSQSVMDILSQHLRILCDRAIDNARAEGRKTVMDRDFQFLRQLK